MAIFPSIWELLLPNLSIWTIMGIALIVAGVLGFVFLGKLSLVLGNMGLPNPIKIFTFMILGGIAMVWGISIAQDFLSSQGGALIFWGSVIVIVLGVILFWNPKLQKKGGSTKIKF